MKQFWIGICLLTVLLFGGLGISDALEEAVKQPAEDLEKAAGCVLEGDWDLASALLTRAEKTWAVRKKWIAVLAHHGALDEIDTLFVRLEAFRNHREGAAFGAACGELGQKLREVPRSHRVNWRNLL